MIVFKKAIHRRSVLRGLGATLALPLLDGMVPALVAMRRTAAAPTNRLAAVYVPNGIMMANWTPVEEGRGFEFPVILKPLEPYRDQLLVLSGLCSNHVPSGSHAGASTKFLTGAPAMQGTELRAGVSMDQLAAREFGRQTQLASLELSLEAGDSTTVCSIGYSCVYTNTIAWQNPTTPLPMAHDPRAVFERLFGDSESTDTAARLARMRTDRSILDSVHEKIAHLQRQVGPEDHARLDEYFAAIRDVERRIQMVEQQSARDVPAVERPRGVPAVFEDHAKLMFDLLTLAYQSDLTRVSTFMMSHEFSGRTYPEIGVPDAHHPTSHHQSNPDKLAKLTKINAFHTTLLAYWLEKLRSIPDGDGTLLDHLALVYGSGLSDGNAHSPDNLPILLIGGGGGQIKGGRHLRFPDGTPLPNLHVTLLDKLGVRVDAIGDSTGQIPGLSGI